MAAMRQKYVKKMRKSPLAGDRMVSCFRPQAGSYTRRWEPAGKPGSVVGNHSSGTAVTGGLVRPTRKRRGPRHCFPIWSCSRWGLPCHRVLPPARCALTAPFHPYRPDSCKPDRRYIFCCTFRRLTPPRGYLAPCPVEPGLSSPSRRWSDCLADSRVYCLILQFERVRAENLTPARCPSAHRVHGGKHHRSGPPHALPGSRTGAPAAQTPIPVP
jgi:hypothetical protein